MAKKLMRIKSRRKASTRRTGSRKIDADSQIDQINFLASAGKLETKSKFTKEQKDDLLAQLERGGATYDMLYVFSEAMNTGKNYEAIIFMLRKHKTFNDCDQQLILEAAEAFIRDVGE